MGDAVGIQMGRETGRDGSTIEQKTRGETGRINEGRSIERRDEMEEMPSTHFVHLYNGPWPPAPSDGCAV